MICHALEYDYTAPDGTVTHIGPDDIRAIDPRRHKYADGMAEYLSTALLGEGDRECGNACDWDVYVAQYGKRLLLTDTRGFVWVQKYATEEDASADYDRIELAWCEYEDEEMEA